MYHTSENTIELLENTLDQVEEDLMYGGISEYTSSEVRFALIQAIQQIKHLESLLDLWKNI